MRRARSGFLALLVGLLLVGVAVPAIGPVRGAPSPFSESSQVEPDRIVLRVDLHADGSATWRIEHWIRLDDENATQAFESLQADIRANRSAFVSRFRNRMLAVVRSAENATNRKMAVRNVSVRTTQTVSYGVVIYEFEWIGFADVDGPRLRAGDAISGLVLGEKTSLVFQWPDAYGVVDVTPPPDERHAGIVIWRGPTIFASDEPRLVLSKTVGTPTSSPVTTDTPTDTSTGATPTDTTVSPTTAGGPPADGTPSGSPSPNGGSGLPTGVFLGGLVVLVIAAAGVWFVSHRRGRPPFDFGAEAAGGDGDEGAGGSEAGGDDEPEGPSEELLSNRERVLRLLEENGGRMKQQAVASELDWTDAKTSQVVGDLRDEDEIEVFRIGRENVLVLPEESDL